MSHFSFDVFNNFFLSFNNLTIMFLDVDLCIYPMWSLLIFLDVWVNVFHQILDVFSHYFFEYFLLLSVCLSFWHLYYTHLSGFDSLLCFPGVLFFFSLIFFPLLFRGHNFYWSLFRFMDSIFCQIKSTVEPSSKFIISVFVLFNSISSI